MTYKKLIFDKTIFKIVINSKLNCYFKMKYFRYLKVNCSYKTNKFKSS